MRVLTDFEKAMFFHWFFGGCNVRYSNKTKQTAIALAARAGIVLEVILLYLRKRWVPY
jgi:hypothetical protein